jgi:hypothetical protein
LGLEDKFIHLGSTNSGKSIDSILDETKIYDLEQVNLMTVLSNENVLDEELFIN